MNDKPLKTAIIGWDSASFQIIAPLLEAGALPNLQHLMEKGSWGPLTSTLHPLSPTAWASFMTGMNPGKHGVFDFVSLDKDGYFRIANGGTVQAMTVWEWLSKADRRVAVVNVPMTYPPRKVNGCLIAGMDAPQIDRPFTYPPELARQLERHFGEYHVGVKAKGRPWESTTSFTERYVTNLCRLVQRRSDVVCYLLDNFTPDFLTVVFTAPDRVQHALGHLMAHPLTPQDGIGRVYRACDAALGRILKRLDEDWVVFVMSDHGACTYRRVFELSTWLLQKRWLYMHPLSGKDMLLNTLAPYRRRLGRLTGRLTKETSRLEQFFRQIEWSKTRAFALGAFGSIFIPTRDRFPHGIVEPGGQEYETICHRITKDLLEIRDPETGRPIVSAVHRGVDVYRGPFTAQAPDLLIETHSDYFVRNNLDQHTGQLTYPAGRYAGRSLAHTGRHTSTGLVVAAGKPFKAEQNRSGASIIDLAPTILYLNDLPIPTEMDGRPLLEWLQPSYRREPRFQQSDSSLQVDSSTLPPFDERDTNLLEAHLRDLGYLD